MANLSSGTTYGTTDTVTSTKLNNQVNNATITDIQGSEIANGAITAAKLGTDSVETTKIKALNVTTAKIADGAITSIKTSGILLSGEVKAVAFEAVPSGWLECNGDAVSRTTYADLYTALVDIWGEGDGSTTFNVPDFRGKFLRGWDNTAGNDPNAGTRTAQTTGGATGDNVGSIQADEYKEHTHPLTGSTTGGATTAPEISVNNLALSADTGANGGDETRPINANVMYIIKT